VERNHRLVVTNAHVVESDDVSVAFPPLEAVKVEGDPLRRFGEPHDFIPGRVVWRDATRDLAIVQLERLPKHVLPLPLAPASAQELEPVYLVGNPGHMFWAPAVGSVKMVQPARWLARADGPGSRRKIDLAPPGNQNPRTPATWVLQAQLPVNKGDSGSPVITDSGNLVAVICGFRADVQQVAMCIDVREVRSVLHSYKQDSGVDLNLPQPLRGEMIGFDRKAVMLVLKDGDAVSRQRALLDLLDRPAEAGLMLQWLIPMLKNSDTEVRYWTGEVLEKLGPPTPDQVVLLRDYLKDAYPRVRLHTVTALGKLGPAAAPELVDLDPLLRDPDPEVRRAVFRTWKATGLHADSLTPTLFSAWDDAPPDVRDSLRNALEAANPENERTMPVLLQAIQVRDVLVRQRAVIALGRFGGAGEAALVHSAYAALLKVLGEERNTLVLQAAAAAVVAVNPAGKEAVPLLARALRADKELRLQAARSLEKMGPVAEPAIRDLIEALADPDPDFHRQGVATLGSIGPRAKAAVPALIKDVKDARRRLDALAALVKIGAPAVPALMRALEEKSLRPARKDIIEALGDIGPTAKEALGPLSLIYYTTRDRDPLHQAARHALKQIQHGSK
jgi:HEAT repeat protein